MLNGYKTYIAALGVALVAIAQILENGHIDSLALLELMSALGLAGLRSAITDLVK